MEEEKKVRGLKYIGIESAAKDIITYMNKRRNGLALSLKTPWKKLNEACMGGIEWQTITTIAGMSGSGKSSIINELETGLFDLNPNEDFSVLNFNFEMLAMKIIGRKLSKELGMTTIELYSGQENKTLSDEDFNRALAIAKDKISKYDIHYVDTPGNVEQIKKTILSFCLKRGNNSIESNHGTIITLDHALLVSGKSGDIERRILFDLMVMMNDLKKSLKVSFILLSQLNRSIELPERLTNSDLHYPKKADIFGADSMYQFSDVVLVSHNPKQLGIRYYGPEKLSTDEKIFWHFLKIREGMPFIALMKDNLKHNEILDYNGEEKQSNKEEESYFTGA
jgi:replicative DNA helicase